METHYLRVYPTYNRAEAIEFLPMPQCAANVIRESTADGALMFWTLRDDGSEKMRIIAPGEWASMEQLTQVEYEVVMNDWKQQSVDAWKPTLRHNEEYELRQAEANR